jgi:hypothetical protein
MLFFPFETGFSGLAPLETAARTVAVSLSLADTVPFVIEKKGWLAKSTAYSLGCNSDTDNRIIGEYNPNASSNQTI